jgi:transcriptional regulator with XRE-family HTH domain
MAGGRENPERREFPYMRSVLIDLVNRCTPPNQSEFGRRVGVRQSTVSEWMQGRIPYRVTREKIAAAFGIEIEEMEARARGRRLDPDEPPIRHRDGPSFPLVNVAPASAMGWHCELGPTTQDSPDRVSAAWLPAARDIFAVRIAGDSMEPVLHDGWIAFFRWRDPYDDAPRPIDEGAIVFLRASEDSAYPDECCIAYWSFDADAGRATLTKASHKFKTWKCVLPPEHIRQVGVFVGMMPKVA